MEFRADGLLSVRILSAFRFRYVYGSEVASLRTSDDEIVSEGEISFNDLFLRIQYSSMSHSILLLYSGKCLSISDAIGRRLRDGDKIRYKVRPDTRLFCSLHILLSVEADAKIDTRIRYGIKGPSSFSMEETVCGNHDFVNCQCFVVNKFTKALFNGKLNIIYQHQV